MLSNKSQVLQVSRVQSQLFESLVKQVNVTKNGKEETTWVI